MTKSETEVTACKDCPHYRFDEKDTHYEWYTWHTCTKENRRIESSIYDMPEWCPCLEKDETVEKRKSVRKWR